MVWRAREAGQQGRMFISCMRLVTCQRVTSSPSFLSCLAIFLAPYAGLSAWIPSIFAMRRSSSSEVSFFSLRS